MRWTLRYQVFFTGRKRPQRTTKSCGPGAATARKAKSRKFELKRQLMSRLREATTKAVAQSADVAAARERAEQAADDLTWLNGTANAFRASNRHALLPEDEQKFKELAERLRIDLSSAARSRSIRAWPVL
jgi:hypothetical protein